MKQIDFKLIQDRITNITFGFTNPDGTIYNLTGSTAICRLYLTTSPIEIICGVDAVSGRITIPFSTTDTQDLGFYEYTLEETKVNATVIPLIKGNITIREYVPFTNTIQAYLNSELPTNITLTEDYGNQRLLYWRRILQSAFNISDANLNIESAWPDLVNVLFAKLIVHDALLLAFTGSTFAFFGGDYTVQTSIGDSVKKIETGPSSVEFFSPADGLVSLFKKGTGGDSPFDELKIQICGLANHLGVKIPHCKGSNIRIIPQIFKPE